MKSYFSKHYARLNNINTFDESSIKSWYQFRILEFDHILKNIELNLKDGKILEVGCGIGGFLFYLEKRGINDFIGIDISEEQLSICKKYSTQNVILGDAINYLQRSTTYDFIFAFDLIEHLEKKSINEFIELCFDKLNNGGVLVIRTPNMSSPVSIFNRYIDFTHEIGFTEFSLLQVVSQFFEEGKILLFNDSISKKRLALQKIISKLIEKIYLLPRREITTSNIYLKAIK